MSRQSIEDITLDLALCRPLVALALGDLCTMRL
jgi:hypothetical protein